MAKDPPRGPHQLLAWPGRAVRNLGGSRGRSEARPQLDLCSVSPVVWVISTDHKSLLQAGQVPSRWQGAASGSCRVRYPEQSLPCLATSIKVWCPQDLWGFKDFSDRQGAHLNAPVFALFLRPWEEKTKTVWGVSCYR